MRRPRSRLLVPLVLTLVALGGAALALAGPPATGDGIRAALPQPDKTLPLAGTVEFVGQDAGKTFNVAVVRSTRGAVLAYVCNGTSIGRWLTGTVEHGVAELTGPKGASLRAVFGKRKVTGSARIGGTRLTFVLSKAAKASGLRRTVARANGATFEAAWIVTNVGVTRGLASEGGGKTVATSSGSANPANDANAGVSPATGGSAPAPDPTVLQKFRCGRIVLGIATINARVLNGTATAQDVADLKALKGKFSSNDCSAFFAL
jgi:hypothetical protein